MAVGKYIGVVFTGDTTDVNLFTLMGSPTEVRTYRFRIATGARIGQVAAAAALTIGQFPAGSIIEIVNQGEIQGRGGAPNGGAGGDAIYATYTNQTVNINNIGAIRAGGGGGGKGGNGGAGGQGGSGTYTATTSPPYDASNFWIEGIDGLSAFPYLDITYGGVVIRDGNWDDYPAPYPTTWGQYERGAHFGFTSGSGGQGVGYAVIRNVPTPSVGGAGGAGGVAGNGGKGFGYEGAGTNAVAPSSPTAGVAGGTGAGRGGDGGTAGASGNGGGWGGVGFNAAGGSNGLTGDAGNVGAGAAGTGGTAGQTGGAAGRAIVKGAATVNITGAGGINGATV
ncbi:hypothetical protein D3C71_79690 [compost metagenome]